MARIPAYRRNATWVTSSGAVNTASEYSPITSAANAISRAEAPTAAPSGSWTRISSTSATRNLARCSSTRSRAVSTASSSRASTVSAVIRVTARPQCFSTALFPASGRKI